LASNIQALALFLGKTGRWHAARGIEVAVRVTDIRQSYGRTDYHVEPLTGSGATWVTSHNISFPEVKA